MMFHDFVLIGVEQCTDSFTEGRKTTIPPQ
jgi:hypothetical protein